MQINPQKVEPYKGTCIFGFNNATIVPKGVVTLSVTLRYDNIRFDASIPFLLVDVESEYNMILGRPTLREFRAVVSQPHFCLKFRTPDGVGVVRGDQEVARRFYQRNFRHMSKDTNSGLPWHALCMIGRIRRWSLLLVYYHLFQDCR